MLINTTKFEDVQKYNRMDAEFFIAMAPIREIVNKLRSIRMKLTNGTEELTLEFEGKWLGQLLAPQKIKVSSEGKVQRRTVASRIGFTFSDVWLDKDKSMTLRTIFEDAASQYLILTVDRNPFSETTKEFKVIFTSQLQVEMEDTIEYSNIKYRFAWEMEQVLYV